MAMLITVGISYYLVKKEIKDIMVADLNSVINSLEAQISYAIAKNGSTDIASDEEFKKSIHNIKVGKSGYVYFIDRDGNFVIHHKKEGKNYAGKEYVDYIRGHKSGFYEYVSATTSQNKFVVFKYIDEIGLWVIPGVNKDDYYINIQEQFIKYFAVIFAVFVSLLSVVNYLTGTSILTPVLKLGEISKRLSQGEGDLTARLPNLSKDEVSIVIEHFNSFIERIQAIVNDSKNSSSSNFEISKNTKSITDSLSGSFIEEKRAVKDTLNFVVDVNETLSSSSEISRNTKENISSVAEHLNEMSSDINYISVEITKTSDIEVELSSKLRELSEQATSVQKVVEIIGDIADQTNLLSLNAAIEASRAGEYGRGFAVVADEVRDLADKTQHSLSEINATISIVVNSIISLSDLIKKNASNVHKLSDKANSMQKDTQEFSTRMNRSVSLAEQNLENFESIKSSLFSVEQKIGDIDKLSTVNDNSIEKLHLASDELFNISQALNENLKKFKS
jgi:methyl-accepting chemotaxis protein